MKTIVKIVTGCLFICIVHSPSQIMAKEDTPSVSEPWSVAKAVDHALKNNPDSQMAKTRISFAQAKLDEANSSLYPRVSILGSYDQTNNPMYSFGNILNQGQFDQDIDFNNPGRTDNLKLQAELLYRLYNGGRDSAAISSSEYTQQSLIASHTSILNQLAFEVVRAFQKIIQAKEMVEARKSAKDAIDASLHVARARHNAGDMLRQDLLNIEVQQASASENLIQARHVLSLTNHAFNNLLGIEKGPVDIIVTAEAEQAIPDILQYSNRPEILVIDNKIAAAKAQLDVVGAGRLPTVDGFASYQYEHGFITDGDGDSWMAGVKVRYSLYEGQATKAKIAGQNAKLEELKALKRKIELALNLELQKADQELQQAMERMAVTQKMVTLARESARLSRARFKEGVILSSDLIDVETRLTDALLRDSSAKAQYRTAIANLRKTVGLNQF